MFYNRSFIVKEQREGVFMIFKLMIIFIFMFCVLQFVMYFDLIKKFIITLCTKKWTTGRLKRLNKLLHNNLVKIRS